MRHVLILFLVTVSMCGESHAQHDSDSVKDVTIAGLRMPDALGKVASVYKVVLSLEETMQPPYGKRLNVQLRGATIEEAVNALTEADPRYAWRKDANGTIRVFSKVSPPDVADVRVGLFEVKELSRHEISAMLDGIGEIRDWLEKNNCSRVEYILGKGWLDDKKKITFSARGRKLRDILDEIAARSEKYFWSVSRHGVPTGCQISIKF